MTGSQGLVSAHLVTWEPPARTDAQKGHTAKAASKNASASMEPAANMTLEFVFALLDIKGHIARKNVVQAILDPDAP